MFGGVVESSELLVVLEGVVDVVALVELKGFLGFHLQILISVIYTNITKYFLIEKYFVYELNLFLNEIIVHRHSVLSCFHTIIRHLAFAVSPLIRICFAIFHKRPFFYFVVFVVPLALLQLRYYRGLLEIGVVVLTEISRRLRSRL